MILPFGLTQKPISHVFEHGQIRFNMREGVMHFSVIRGKRNRPRFVVLKGIVNTREELNYLRSIKEFPIRVNAKMEIVPPTHDRRSIEVVN